jgi:hypothetical protein
MFLLPPEMFEKDLDESRWRVDFHRSLLEAHRSTPKIGMAWFETEQRLRRNLGKAKVRLERLERLSPHVFCWTAC